MPSTIAGTIWVKIMHAEEDALAGHGQPRQRIGGQRRRAASVRAVAPSDTSRLFDDRALPALVGEQRGEMVEVRHEAAASSGSPGHVALRLEAGDEDPERREDGPDDERAGRRSGSPPGRSARGTPDPRGPARRRRRPRSEAGDRGRRRAPCPRRNEGRGGASTGQVVLVGESVRRRPSPRSRKTQRH